MTFYLNTNVFFPCGNMFFWQNVKNKHISTKIWSLFVSVSSGRAVALARRYGYVRQHRERRFRNTPVFKARTIFIQILGHIWTQPTLLAPATFGTILGKNFANFRGI